MIKKVMDEIKKHNMIKEHDHVIAGVSGGADSVCLFLVLLELKEKLKFTMSVVHVEHGIRGEESKRDAEFVKRLARKYGIECTVLPYQVPALAEKYKMSLEETARKVRYEALEREAFLAGKRYGIREEQVKTAVAHHMEDLAETMVFHLCRGSGVEGLSGIPPVRGRIIRPFLGVTRQEIEAYLLGRGQEFCRDVTNDSREYSRNFIRHEIMPGLGLVNSQSVKHMAKTAEELCHIAGYLKEQTDLASESVLRQDGEKMFCDAKKLGEIPSVIRSRVLKKALETMAGSNRDIAREHVEALLDLAEGSVGRKVSLPCRLEAARTYEGIEILHGEKECRRESISFGRLSEQEARGEKGAEIITPKGKICCRIWKKSKKDTEIPKKKYTKWLDYDKIKGGLLFRTRNPGDYFILDDKGHRKNLKDYFINEKVPRGLRDEIVLAADDSHIVWAVGYRISQEYKVTEDTREILEIRWMEEKDERKGSCTFV